MASAILNYTKGYKPRALGLLAFKNTDVLIKLIYDGNEYTSNIVLLVGIFIKHSFGKSHLNG